jgi:hypothetical protein
MEVNTSSEFWSLAMEHALGALPWNALLEPCHGTRSWSLAMEHALSTVSPHVSFAADRICPTHKQLSGNSDQIKCEREIILL